MGVWGCWYMLGTRVSVFCFVLSWQCVLHCVVIGLWMSMIIWENDSLVMRFRWSFMLSPIDGGNQLPLRWPRFFCAGVLAVEHDILFLWAIAMSLWLEKGITANILFAMLSTVILMDKCTPLQLHRWWSIQLILISCFELRRIWRSYFHFF